jgi:hypothetical protein
MKKLLLLPTLLLLVHIAASCGNGAPEVVKADSSVTSTSAANVPGRVIVNTDTTSAAPALTDTMLPPQADTLKPTPPIPAKKPTPKKESRHPPKAPAIKK